MDTFMDQVDTITKPTFKAYFLRILILFLIFSGISCKEQESENKSAEHSIFFDQAKNKFWGHQANNPDKANALLKEYIGIEFDVVFETESNRFNIRHDIEAPSSPFYLDDYFNRLNNFQTAYFWLDFKNLNDQNAVTCARNLIQTLNKYEVLDRCIVESYNLSEILLLNEMGINVSFWVPNLDGNSGKEDTLRSLELIQEAIESNNINALSAPYQMYDFLNQNFPDQNIHIWTNGLSGENGKSKILEFNSKSNIKVILVDYEENFISSP